MSNYEFEEGRFTLPSAEFASFRKGIQDADRAHKERVFALTQECWKSLTRKQQTNGDEYQKAVSAFIERKYDEAGRHAPAGRWTTFAKDYSALPGDLSQAIEDADGLLRSKVHGWNPDTRAFETLKPTRVLQSEMKYPTNRTTTYSNGEASVTFDPKARAVTWAVGENNHAVERARETPLGKAFFARLDKVRWTHGTGGTIRYGSEYMEDDWGHRRGAETSKGYGYIGISEAPTQTAPFQNAKGEWIGPKVSYGRNATAFTAKPVKVPAPNRGLSARGAW